MTDDFYGDDLYDEDPLTADEYGLNDPIYGGEGHGSGNARQLLVIQKLADRSDMTAQERILLLDSDMREAMAFATRRLQNEAAKYSVQGFTWDLDDIVFEHGGPPRTITATLRVSRE